jgi:hypothetical protein
MYCLNNYLKREARRKGKSYTCMNGVCHLCPGLSCSLRILRFLSVTVSKVTLDIISETAFGYKANSVLDPRNELAEAYEVLVNL